MGILEEEEANIGILGWRFGGESYIRTSRGPFRRAVPVATPPPLPHPPAHPPTDGASGCRPSMVLDLRSLDRGRGVNPYLW